MKAPYESEQTIRKSATNWRQPVALATTAVATAPPRSLGIGRAIRNEWLALGAACGPFEWMALGYFAVSSILIAVFAENLAHPVRLLATRACVVALILLLCRGVNILIPDNTNPTTFTQKFWHFWRHWYPHLFFLFCFEELAHLVHLVVPTWQDAKLIAFDFWLTGVHPSIWLEQFTTPFRNDTSSSRILEGIVKHATITGGVPGTFSELQRSPAGDPRGSSQNDLQAEFLGDYVYAVATRTYGAAVWNDTRNAADCPAIDAWRASLRTGIPLARPAPQTDCPGTFGNSDIFSFP